MSRVIGSAMTLAAEDPFGPGDPVQVARLVRRALAAAGAKAVDVTALLMVVGAPVDHAALGRFTRRALGPHGASLAPVVVPSRASTHEARCTEAAEVGGGFRDQPVGQAVRSATAGRSVVIVVALGPGEAATALCLGDADVCRRPPV